MANIDNSLNKEDLIKSLQDTEAFSEEEINEIVEKAEKEGKFTPVKDIEVVDKPSDYKADKEKKKEEDPEDDNDMKKAYGEICSMKQNLDKAMSDFNSKYSNKYGSIPGIPTPTGDPVVVKSLENELGVDSIQKAFGDKIDSISKAIEDQQKLNIEITKSLDLINKSVGEIANAPNPFKGLFGNYNGNVLEKADKFNEEGKKVLSLSRNKNDVNNAFEKAIDVVKDESDKKIVRDMISTYAISGITSRDGLNIVSKALDIDFEK